MINNSYMIELLYYGDPLNSFSLKQNLLKNLLNIIFFLINFMPCMNFNKKN